MEFACLWFPLATQLGWPYVFYICILFWEKVCELFPKLKRNPFLGGLIISISGLLIDLNLDIYASRFNWWVWNPSLKPIWFGVPLTNYLAWFWAVYWFGVLWVLAYQDPKDTTIPVKTPKERTIFITKLRDFCAGFGFDFVPSHFSISQFTGINLRLVHTLFFLNKRSSNNFF